MFRIIFVLDILNGKAVHAVRGERSGYQPIRESKVCSSSDPLEIISNLMPKEVYIADLDRLQHQGDNFDLIKKISERTKTMVDMGVESMSDIEKGMEIADEVIIGTETGSLELIDGAARQFPGMVNVSMDIKDGSVLTRDRKMAREPLVLMKLLNEYAIRDIIVLNLNKVGTGEGIDKGFLSRMAGLSDHGLIGGGGIRDMDDIKTLEEMGIRGALAATAVHNGKIPLEFIRDDNYL